jgi:hypothetical protein
MSEIDNFDLSLMEYRVYTGLVKSELNSSDNNQCRNFIPNLFEIFSAASEMKRAGRRLRDSLHIYSADE